MKYVYILTTALLAKNAIAVSDNTPKFNASLEAGWSQNSALSVAELDDISSQQDSGLMLKANLNGKWQASDKTLLQSSYSYTRQNYKDTDQYDLSMHLGAIDAAYSLSWFDVGVRHDAATASLAGDSFLRFNQSSLYVAKLVGGNTFVRANGTFKTKQFANAQQRDADSVGAGLDVFYFLNAGATMLSAGVNTEQESATDAQFNFAGVNLNTKLSHDFSMLGKNSKLSIAWRYQKRDYDPLQTEPEQTDPLAMDENLVTRADSQHIYQLQWQIKLLARLALKTQVEVGDYRSTLEQQTYGQTVTSISLQASF